MARRRDEPFAAATSIDSTKHGRSAAFLRMIPEKSMTFGDNFPMLLDSLQVSTEQATMSKELNDNSTKPTTKREETQRRFLEAFRRELGHIGKAARRAGIHRDTHYGWLQDDNDEGYRKAFAAVKQDLVEDLEAEADRRALKGTLKPVFYQGEACGQIREFSDLLLIFRLKALKPEMYRENVKIDQAVKHSGAMNLKKKRFDFDEFRRLCELERAERTLPGGHVSIHKWIPHTPTANQLLLFGSDTKSGR